MHNGTIRPGNTAEQFINEKYKGFIQGTTDSERFFYAVLSAIDELGLVEGIRRVFELADSLDSPVNLGNPGEFSMIELANKVIAISGSKSKIEFEVLPEDDPKQRKPDIQKARELLGWQPSIELDKGIEKTTSYFRKVLGL